MDHKATLMKEALRKDMLQKRAAMRQEQAKAKSVAAQRLLLESDYWQTAEIVGLYMAIKGETGTELLLANALEKGKKIILPRVESLAARKMEFLEYDPDRGLELGGFGLAEPALDCRPIMNCDCLVVPGVCFDLAGYRVGYGAGFYDAYFAHNPDFTAIKIGLCFDFQIVEKAPHASWDMKVDVLCTEDGLIWT